MDQLILMTQILDRLGEKASLDLIETYDRAVEDRTAQLVSECEAFLAGRMTY